MKLTFIQQKIYEIRVQKVMLDFDIAELYQVETKRLKEAVRRNNDRFPSDFMFQLTKDELGSLRTQIATSNKRGGVRYLPFAFTEHGVTMPASILRSDKAIKMNIAIVRAFIALKQFALDYKDLAYQINEIKQTVSNHSDQLNQIYDAIEKMMDEKEDKQEEKRRWKEREKIGFKSSRNT